MADALAIIGGVAAGLQLVSGAAQTLLATIKLIKDLREIPGRLRHLLSEVDDSISRLCYSCNSGSVVFQNLDPPQASRLSRSVAALCSALNDIQAILTPLVGSNEKKAGPIRNLWKNAVSLKVEKDLVERLQRLNRLNMDVLRELGIVGLEKQALTNNLIIANGDNSRRGFTTIEAKLDSLQSDFEKFSLLPIHPTSHTSPKQKLPPSSNSPSEVNLFQSWPQGAMALSKERATQIERYLAGDPSIGTAVGFRIVSPQTLSSANLDYILFSIRAFYTMGNFDASPLVTRSRFWKDTDLGIYLMKVAEGSQRGASASQMRGFRILKESTANAAESLHQGTATVIIEILSTLAPVNTATCPYVREGLIRYLCEMAREQLPDSHPIALILAKLKTDQDSNVTIRALGFLLDRLRSTVGPLHDLSQLAVNRLCGILRRSGDYDEALRVAKEGVHSIVAILGPGSLQERRLSRQLAHVYMDKSEWVEALSVCFEIVGQQRLETGMPDPMYQDECAVKTMEDIAKICECSGNVEQAIMWLKQAILSGGFAWGQTEAVEHIRDKLRELLTQANRKDEVEVWTEG